MIVRALVLGGAACVWDDAKAAKRLCQFDFTVACNDIGTQWPERLDYWVTLHPEKFRKWQDAREANGFNTDYKAITWPDGRSHNARIDGKSQDWGGSSGLLCIKVALEAGANKVVLAGVPMNSQPHFFDPKNWKFAPTYQPRWQRHLEKFKNQTRSMSGWTKDILGFPDREFLGDKRKKDSG